MNQALVDFALEILKDAKHSVLHTNIDDGYDILEECEKHEWADLVITQMPVYWFGGPWTYKKYVDEVFNSLIRRQKLAISDGRSRFYDKQYGTGGIDHGKKFLLSTTWNAPRKAFGDSKQYLFEGKTLDDAMIAITSVYKFMGFEILPVFACYDVKKAPQINEDFERFKDRLTDIF